MPAYALYKLQLCLCKLDCKLYTNIVQSLQYMDSENIPGVSLNGRATNSLKIPELKRWLDCRGASIKGNKADLVLRYCYRFHYT